MDVWALIDEEAGADVTIDLGSQEGWGAFLPGLRALLLKLRACGLDRGPVLLSLLSALSIDPLDLWEVVWQSATDLEAFVMRDGKPDYLYARDWGFFPFGDQLEVDTGTPLPAYEGVLCISVQSKLAVFLRQTGMQKIDSPYQAAEETEIKNLVRMVQSFYGGHYIRVWVIDPAALAQDKIDYNEMDEKYRKELLKNFVGAAIRHARVQWQLEQEQAAPESLSVPLISGQDQAERALVEATKTPDRSEK